MRGKGGKKKKKKSHLNNVPFFTLQTDDKGVFCTDLSQEYQLAASTFGLSHEAVWKLSQQAIDCIFGPEIVKQQLQEKWNDLHPQLFKWSVHRSQKPTTYLKFKFFFLKQQFNKDLQKPLH